MKASIAALAVMLSSLVSAHAVTTSKQVANYFIDANGNVGVISAIRQTDPATNVSTTTTVGKGFLAIVLLHYVLQKKHTA